MKAIIDATPDVVASFAAKSSPEWCQKRENLEEMVDVNSRGVVNLGTATQQLNIPTVTISTDHIFGGRSHFNWYLKRWLKAGPYDEDYVKIFPTNQYGISKYAGETMASSFPDMKVVRTSYLFDSERVLDEIFRITKNHNNTKSYPTFIHRSFMHVDHFVISMMAYLKKIEFMPQTLHISGSKTVSWAKFMQDAVGMKGGVQHMDKVLTHKKNKKNLCPRPHKAGLVTELSAELGLPQFDYMDGLALL